MIVIFQLWNRTTCLYMSIAEIGVPKMQLVLISLNFTDLPLWSLPVIQTRAWYPNKRRLPAEWPGRPKSRRSGWLGATAVGSSPLLSTFFSFSLSPFSFFLSSLFTRLILPRFKEKTRKRERERERESMEPKGWGINGRKRSTIKFILTRGGYQT